MTNPLEHPLISNRYFYPRYDEFPDIFWVPQGNIQLACYRVHQNDDALTFIHYHGNGEVISDYLPDFSDTLLEMGVNVCFAEYRGYGRSSGTPSLVSMLDDTTALFEALALPASRLVVYGRSIGSIYAIEFAHRYPTIAGLILESGIADPLERVLLRVDPEELGISDEALAYACSQHLDHHRKLQGYQNPLLVLHTRHDGLVDLSHAQRNYEWASSTQKKLHIFERGDHNSLLFVNQHPYHQALADFLDQLRSP